MLLVNGHGGNVTAIRDALARLADEGRHCHALAADLAQTVDRLLGLDAARQAAQQQQ
jgi:creatinine amidohydrolase/Fe(II)-dependent formamide hydrolase-like protein